MSNRRSAPVPVTGFASRDIGGAIVRRRFTYGGKDMVQGTVLTAGEVLSMPRNNFNALRDNNFISTFPKAVRTHLERDPEEVKLERFVINRGFGKFDVIEGKQLNPYPLTKDKAEALADQIIAQNAPEPPAVKEPIVVGPPGAPIRNADGTILPDDPQA